MSRDAPVRGFHATAARVLLITYGRRRRNKPRPPATFRLLERLTVIYFRERYENTQPREATPANAQANRQHNQGTLSIP